METCKRYLKYQFSEEEKKNMGDDLAQKFASKHETEDKLKAVSTQIKSEINALDAIMGGLAEKIRSGYEMRDVECEIERDFKNARITITRLDTGEIVESRAMTPEERQKKLFEENKK